MTSQNYKSKPFEIALSNFLAHIESLWTSLPIVLKTIEKTEKAAMIEHQTFLEQNCEYIEKDNHYVIPIDHYRKNTQLRKAVQNSANAIKIIKRNFLVSLVSQYDTYTSELIKAIFEVRPEIINASEKQLTYSELTKFKDLQAAQEFIIEKEVETVLRESHTEQFKWFERKLEVQLRKDLPAWQTFVEITQRRNLFVHNDGKVSNQYLTVCKENSVQLDDKLEIGQNLSVGFKYFDRAFKCLFEIGVKLNQVLRRKLVPTEIEMADHSFLLISFELIQNRQYDLARVLYDFSDKHIKKYSTEDLRLRILLNRAQTYKWLNNEEECAKIIKSEDWSACGDVFKLASFVLTDRFEDAAKVMKSIGNNENILPKTYYRDWPIFKIFRTSPEFRAAYLEIYSIDFEIVEENESSQQRHL